MLLHVLSSVGNFQSAWTSCTFSSANKNEPSSDALKKRMKTGRPRRNMSLHLTHRLKRFEANGCLQLFHLLLHYSGKQNGLLYPEGEHSTDSFLLISPAQVYKLITCISVLCGALALDCMHDFSVLLLQMTWQSRNGLE